VENDPIEELLLGAYPNPERKGCPGSDTIRGLANKAIPHDDPAWQHIWKCSPCFAEFKELRDARRFNERAVRRKRNLYWATAAGIILLCIGAALAVLFLKRPKVPQHAPVANVPTATPAYPAAVLNLEGVSTPRSAEKSPSGGPVQIQTLPRRAVDLTVYLPRGSEMESISLNSSTRETTFSCPQKRKQLSRESSRNSRLLWTSPNFRQAPTLSDPEGCLMECGAHLASLCSECLNVRSTPEENI
jgi:hypothetical protein